MKLTRTNVEKGLRFYFTEYCTSQKQYDEITELIKEADYKDLYSFFIESKRAIFELVLIRLKDTKFANEVKRLLHK